MYDTKIFLYFALAIVGFLLWNAWQIDYAPKPIPAVSTIAPTAKTSIRSPETTQNRTIPKDHLIEVKTDILDVKIDKMGGNILSLKLRKYPVSYGNKAPETLLTDAQANYYAAQSGLVDKNGLDTSNLVFEIPNVQYQLQPRQDKLSIVLSAKNDGQEIKKIYLFQRDKYDIKINYQVINPSNKPWVGNMYARIMRRGLSDDTGTFGLHTYKGAAISSANKPYEKISYKDMDKNNLDRTIKGGWLAMQERYFVSSWIPNANDTLNYYSSTASIGPTNKPQDKIYTIGFQTPEITVPSNTTKTIGTLFYAGPEMADKLQQVAPHLDLVIDYGWFSIFSVPILKVMEWIYLFVHNWGLAIILVTVLIKLLFYKLSESSYRSMARMKNLQPRLLALKDRYGDDRQKLSQATMELYRKEKVNPLGGCLPMVIQIPVFIALYYVLIESVQLRQAPFIFWIHDLSVKDPYYVLPVLMGLSWMLQQKLNPPPPDPVQAKMMMLFPVVFTVLFATFPAGLVLYWIVNNCLSILQQWYIMRKVDNKGPKKKSVAKGRFSSSR